MTTHRLDRPLRWCLGTVATIHLAGLAYALLVVVVDLSSHSDEADGFGVLVGVALLVMGVVPACLTALALLLSLRRRESAAAWALGAGIAAVGEGVLVAGAGSDVVDVVWWGFLPAVAAAALAAVAFWRVHTAAPPSVAAG